MTSLSQRLREAGSDYETDKVFPELYAYVTKVATALFRTRRAVPTHGGRYTAEDVHDLVTDFFVPPGRILDLAVAATDDAHLNSALEQSLVRLSVDSFRRTPLGTLRKRAERRLAQRDDVVVVPPRHWALCGHESEPPWSRSRAELEAAVAGVHVDPPGPETKSGRQPMATSTRSLDEVCTRLLEAAGAPVSRTDVLAVVGRRILPGEDTKGLLARAEQDEENQPEDLDAPWGVGSAVAREVWDALDVDERALLPDVWVPGRTLEREGMLELKKSALDKRQKKLSSKLEELLDGLDEVSEAAKRLLDLAASSDTGQDRDVEP